MINAVSFNIAGLSLYKEKKLKSKPVFCGAGKDVFVSTIPKINKLTKNKVDEICPAYLKYRESAGVKSSVAEVKKYLQIELKKGDDGIIVAKLKDKPVAFLHYGVERSTLRPAERIRLKALFVEEEYRGKGISKQLIQRLQEEAGEREVVVKARRSNEVSPHVYLNSGFVEDEEYYHLVYKK